MTKFIVSVLIISSLNLLGCQKTENTENSKEIKEAKEIQKVVKIEKLDIIIDSRMSFEEAVKGAPAPQEIIEQLVLIDVEYYSTDNRLHQGQVLLNKSIKEDIVAIFELIKQIKFPVSQAVPIVAYDWNDELSMAANNTSAFCYRKVAGTTRLSRHAMGKAIDINPLYNPLMWKAPYQDRLNQPERAVYDINVPGTFYKGHPVVQEFTKRNFLWGYYLPKYYDMHHFHKK